MFKLQFKSTLGSHTQKTLIPSLRSLKKKSLHHGCFCYFNTDRFHRVNTSVYIYILISYKYITFTQTFFMWKFIPVKIHEIMQRITRVVDEEFCKKNDKHLNMSILYIYSVHNVYKYLWGMVHSHVYSISHKIYQLLCMLWLCNHFRVPSLLCSWELW